MLLGSNSSDDGDWYAVYTRHHHEQTVALTLSSKGFETFLPVYTTAHRWKDRTKELRLPLFPSYVFLRGPVERWSLVQMTPGINSVVGYAGHPALIPRGQIDTVRQLVAGPLRVEPHPFLKCGDWVRVKNGLLEGVEGILVAKKNVFRLVLSVELLHRSVSVEVDGAIVEPSRAPRALPVVPHRV